MMRRAGEQFVIVVVGVVGSLEVAQHFSLAEEYFLEEKYFLLEEHFGVVGVIELWEEGTLEVLEHFLPAFFEITLIRVYEGP